MRQKKFLKKFIEDNAVMIDSLISNDERKKLHNGDTPSSILLEEINKELEGENGYK
jgi:ribosome-associated protein YbcJ (S4-like RNA binding protein)